MIPVFAPPLLWKQYSARISDFDDSSFTGINSGDAVTFTGMDAGSPRPDRLLIALFHTRDGTEDATINRSVTIGGVTATEVRIAGLAGGGGTSIVAIFAAVVPDGETVDVAVTITNFGGTFDAWGCTLVRATGLASTTPTATANGVNDQFVTLDTTGAKFAVVICGEINDDMSASTPYSSSADSVLTLGHRMTYGLAFIDSNPAGAATDYSITGYSALNPNTFAAACWG